jgi:prepilin-type N-terminal cleavage/methylation domain-containing protein
MMRNSGVEERAKGFSLIEVLVATVVIVIALVGVLGCLAGAVGFHHQARRQAELTLEKWNDSRLFRDRIDPGGAIEPAAEPPPLRRLVVGGDGSPEWEILHHD